MGSISFFVANPIYGNVELSKEDSAILAKEFEDGFRDRFSKSPLHEFFTITSFEWRLGCLEGIFCFGVLGALITGIIAYPKLKKGILEIYKDYTWLRSKLTKRLTCSYKPAPKGFGIIFISILTDKYKAVYISHKENTCKKTI